MNLTLWIISGILAAAYLVAGSTKLFLPREKLAAAPGGGWVEDFGADKIKTIGSLEILGALGLTLPAVFDIATFLVPLAALGLALIMTGAVITRIRRHETVPMVVDLIYLVLATFVVWGRFGPESFS